MHNGLRIYGDRAVSEPTTLRRGMCGAGNLGPEERLSRKRPRAGQTGPEWDPFRRQQDVVGDAAGVSGHGQIFTAGVRGGNLKTWKTEKLTS